MKSIKTYLIVVFLLLVGAMSLGVYVWYTVQKTSIHMDELSVPAVTPKAPEGDRKEQSEKKLEEATSSDTNNLSAKQTEPDPVPEVTKPVVVDTNTLSDSQQKILKALGYEGSSITITPAMISCAEDAVGKDRMGEIMNGSSPSPLESIKLLPCFKA